MNVFETIRNILADQLSIDPESLTMETDMLNDLDADSLDVVDVVMSLEDEFGIEIPDEAIEDIRLVGDLVKYVEANAETED